jgi:Ran GTPase-activating protein (RanGAP) involved in mRNA processing and transport
MVKNQLTDAAIAPLAQSLMRTKDLKSVYMSHNKISNEALVMLADALAVNEGIEEISLTHNDLSLPNGVKLL